MSVQRTTVTQAQWLWILDDTLSVLSYAYGQSDLAPSPDINLQVQQFKHVSGTAPLYHPPFVCRQWLHTCGVGLLPALCPEQGI